MIDDDDIGGTFISSVELCSDSDMGGSFVSLLEFSPDIGGSFVPTLPDIRSPSDSDLANFALHPWFNNKTIPISITAPDFASTLFITSPFGDVHDR